MLPNWIQNKIEEMVGKISPSLLRKAQESLSAQYRRKDFSQSIFQDEGKRLAYLATRFPATFSAVHAVLKELVSDFSCKKILDLGAGPATATLAAFDLFPEIEEATLIEKSKDAAALGRELLEGSSLTTKWICADLQAVDEFPQVDLAIMSYSLGEIKGASSFLQKIWKGNIGTFALIEPGTPTGYQTILEAREFFIKMGAEILAPCPHREKCPLLGRDWCHFSTRLPRTKLHRLLKEGSLGFEDEKFSYLLVSRSETPVKYERILRHPFKGSGHVRLNLCTKEGRNEEKTVSRKEGESYRAARDAEWGNRWIF